MARKKIRIAQEPDADALLSRDPLALLIGMLLDQQFPMERAFAGPALIAERLGTRDRLDAQAIATTDTDVFLAVMKGPPAVHRYPGSMGERVQTLCRIVADEYDGDGANVWAGVRSGQELYDRLIALPGFGDQKSRIFVALLGKQLGVRPRGWREAAGAYGEDGSRRSVADVRNPGTLAEVRAFKQEAKAAAKAARGPVTTSTPKRAR